MNPYDPNGQQPPQGPPPPQGPYRPVPPYQLPPRSGLAIGAFVVALLGFILGIIPFFGLIGTIGLIMGIVDSKRPDPPGQPQRHDLGTAAIILGALATLGVGVWTTLFILVEQATHISSCPHVYAYNGREYRLDADPVSGALYAGAERDDLDRLESLRAVDGEYRVRIQNDLQEVDHIDSFVLLAADAPAGTEVLPTQDGHLVAVRDAAVPIRATDAAGHDILAAVGAEDGRMLLAADHGTRSASGDPREVWTFEFARPRNDRALLVIRGHNTRFAEEAFVRYLATMGRGVRPLLEWAESDPGEDCYREYLHAEIERLGLPMWVSVSSRGSTSRRAVLQPVGPAISRSQALPIAIPAGDERVVVSLEATPRFWEIDQVQLAPDDGGTVVSRTIAVRSAVMSSGANATAIIASNDARRVVLRPREYVEVHFETPTAPGDGMERTVVARMRGYYEMDVGGGTGINPFQIVAHRMGFTSLPRFAAGL